MPKYKNDERRNKGKLVSFQIIFKHRGELNEAYLGAIKDCLYEFLGNVSKSNISIRKIYNKRVV